MRVHVPVGTEDAVIEAGQPLATFKRARGRPKGSKTKIVHGHVSADEFAFLRAVAQGVDLAVASRTYIMWPNRHPERAGLEAFHRELLLRVASGARALPDTRTAKAMVSDLLTLQTIPVEAVAAGTVACVQVGQTSPIVPVSAEVAIPAVAVVAQKQAPTLEEFASQFDEDMYTESELVELYQEAYPVNPELPGLLPSGQGPSCGDAIASPGSASIASVDLRESLARRVERLLAAIDWLDQRLGLRPERDQVVEQWIKLTQSQRVAMNEAGVITLGDLVDWISLQGSEWFEKVPRYGVVRARALEFWLLRWDLQPRQGLRPLGQLAVLNSTTLAPSRSFSLSTMKWPEDLRGHNGVFRSTQPNMFDAHDDLQAIQRWFDLIRKKAAGTQAAYRRGIERLVLWAIHEKRKALSSLTTPDLQEFEDFLRNPPAHWVQNTKGNQAGDSPDWRPLRAPLKDKSVNLTFAAVGAMFKSWHSKNYIISNPAEGISGPKRTEITLDVSRSFTTADLLLIQETFNAIEDSPTKRRLRAILRLLESSGLRREELENARWSDLELARVEGTTVDGYVLNVVGKGKRQRKVPITPGALAALEVHRQDRIALAKTRKLSMFSSVKPEDMPLIGVIDDQWISSHDSILAKRRDARRQAAAGGDLAARTALAEERFTVNDHGGLSSAGIYSVLRAFFKKCASRDERPTSAFERASTHWLRHTFAHHALKSSGKDLTVVQALLGHDAITTTAIYLKADMARRMETSNGFDTAV
ncbi:tyrosine-type recombinase/integrase [Acidovorax sp.]|uniref:tyrosine-type recombinase/integrase n=1 Tax=Acidovorax sp. TaxID=1872122 RepID=UPI00391F41BB